MKTIAVFNTTYYKNKYPQKIIDGLAFLGSMFALLDYRPDIRIIFKEKNPIEYVPKELQYPTAPRFEYIDYHIEAFEIIKRADLVISDCFTSPTLEALEMKVPAIYYDASEKYYGTYYDQFPILLACGWKHLTQLCDLWLDKNYADKKFMEKHLEKLIEMGLDIKPHNNAIRLFRILLTKEG